MEHPNIDLVRTVYGAYMAGDTAAMREAFEPGVRWHNSGFDANAGDLAGLDEVFAYLFSADHLEDYRLEVTDMLASDERVAVVAQTSGRRGDIAVVNNYVQLIRIEAGRIAEVWNYNWDQRALAEVFPVAVPA
jgi:ketosteroid isomerase-like protein